MKPKLHLSDLNSGIDTIVSLFSFRQIYVGEWRRGSDVAAKSRLKLNNCFPIQSQANLGEGREKVRMLALRDQVSDTSALHLNISTHLFVFSFLFFTS